MVRTATPIEPVPAPTSRIAQSLLRFDLLACLLKYSARLEAAPI